MLDDPKVRLAIAWSRPCLICSVAFRRVYTSMGCSLPWPATSFYEPNLKSELVRLRSHCGRIKVSATCHPPTAFASMS